MDTDAEEPSARDDDTDAQTNAEEVSVRAVDDGDGVVLSVGDSERELTTGEAAALRSALGEAVANRREFVHTAGQRRPDGSYAVHRRGADSTGNTVVFDSFGALCRLYERLPATFDAPAVGREGITGSRRHLVARHLAEHPTFPCRIESRNPLQVRTDGGDDGDGTALRADATADPETDDAGPPLADDGAGPD